MQLVARLVDGGSLHSEAEQVIASRKAALNNIWEQIPDRGTGPYLSNNGEQGSCSAPASPLTKWWSEKGTFEDRTTFDHFILRISIFFRSPLEKVVTKCLWLLLKISNIIIIVGKTIKMN